MLPISGSSPAVADAPGAENPGRHPSPKNAKVYFVYPTNHAYVTRTPVIRFGLIGMGVAPAPAYQKANTGHHHLLIDAPLPPMNQPIPNDFNHLHFGTGTTEAQVTLPLGEHTLQLLLGDGNSIHHNPQLSIRVRSR